MPIVEELMSALTAKYGAERGKHIYYAMEAEGSGPFAPGAKHHDLHLAFAEKHGVAPIEGPRRRRRRKR